MQVSNIITSFFLLFSEPPKISMDLRSWARHAEWPYLPWNIYFLSLYWKSMDHFLVVKQNYLTTPSLELPCSPPKTMSLSSIMTVACLYLGSGKSSEVLLVKSNFYHWFTTRSYLKISLKNSNPVVPPKTYKAFLNESRE